MDEHEVRRHPRLDAAGVLLTEQLATRARHRMERLARREPGLDEMLHVPGEMARAHRAAAEVGADRDANAGAPRRRDGRVGTLLALRDACRRVRAGEPLERRRATERFPRAEDRECRHMGHAVALHRPRDIVVDLHAVLDRVDAGLRGDARAVQVPSVARHPRAARVHRVGHGFQRGDAERRVPHTARCVQVDLDEVGAEVELVQGRGGEPVVVGRDPHVGVPGLADPRSGDPDVRVAGRRADVASPQDARLHEPPRVVPRDLPQHGRWVVAARDPMTAALHGQVAVAVDHPRDDDRAAGIDHRRAVLVDLVVRADGLDRPVADRDAHAEPQGVGRAVGECGVVEDRAGHVVLCVGPGWPSFWYLPL